jgi:hypothetical protein
VDNAAYLFLLAEKTRKRVELRGRIELTNDEADRLNWSKEWHATCVVLSIGGAVAMGGLFMEDWSIMISVVLPFLFFGVAACAEAVRHATTPAECALAVAKSLGKELLGFVGFCMFAILAQGSTVHGSQVAPDGNLDEYVKQVRAGQ